MNKLYLKEFLEEKYLKYNDPVFLTTDPLQVPHRYTANKDIEISSFLTATISWGQRKTIINNALSLMKMMDDSPTDFILNAGNTEYKYLEQFKHRTFNGIDTVYFIKSLKNIYNGLGGLKVVFETGFQKTGNIRDTIIYFRKVFIKNGIPGRTYKHIADIEKNASGKRINLFLRWMIRNDHRGVDFGIWSKIPASALFIPLDIHTGNTARRLGLLNRKQNNWTAVEELTGKLRELDPEDPVKYDFALFGLGVFENF